MRKTLNPGVAVSSLALGAACVLAFVPRNALRATPSADLTQAVIAYGFLSSNYGDFDKLLGAGSALGLAGDMKALEGALGSLNCDVPIRIGFPHRAFVVPSYPVGQWIGSIRTAETPPQEGTLLVTEHLRMKPARVLVVLSSVAPERTTVFWIEGTVRGYLSRLVYDSFRKGKIANAPHTVIGAVTAASAGRSDEIFVKEWAEPGSRPRTMGSVGRVFKVDPARDEVTLKSPGLLPQEQVAP